MTVKVDLDREAALVLFDFLSRTLDAQNGDRLRETVDDDAELWALNDLHLALEQTLVAPFEEDYAERVDRARETIKATSGTWPFDRG